MEGSLLAITPITMVTNSCHSCSTCEIGHELCENKLEMLGVEGHRDHSSPCPKVCTVNISCVTM